MSNHMFTVVTVCFNAEKEISDTMKSVLGQTCVDYEYIVIDGKSTDGTVAYVRETEQSFFKKGVSFTLVSEKDTGIYNAMNKAVDLANGEYIVFINAGDSFYSDSTLADVKSYIADNDCDIVVGDIIIRNNGLYLYKNTVFKDLNSQIDVCHQSTYTRTSLLKERKYDESYKLAADRDFLCYSVSKGCRVSVFHKPLSIYLEGGASATDRGINEIKQINSKYGISNGCDTPQHTEYEREDITIKIKRKLHYLIPKFIIARRHKRQMLNAGWSPDIPGGSGEQDKGGKQNAVSKEEKEYGKLLTWLCLKIGGIRLKGMKKRWKKRLKNSDFSIICSSCIGGVIYHDLGLPFLSPTVNLFMTQNDLIKFALRLKYYCSLKLNFIQSDKPYPVAMLDDIRLDFNHYHTDKEAEEAWERRKARINYDNIYVIFYYRDGHSIEEIRKIESAECKKVMVLSHKPIDIEYSLCLKGNGRADQNYMEKDKFGIRTFEKEWDFVSWLNS